MLLYIKNLLPRLRLYSQSLDKIELLVEHPWVLIDDEGNQQKYIFQRNGELIMSLNGKVSIGNWKYLSSAKSLLIDRVQDKILLNQDFVDPAVMALRMDGNRDMPFVMANENLLPNLDVKNYLLNLYYEKNNIRLIKTKSGEVLEIFPHKAYGQNNRCFPRQVTINQNTIPDGTYVSQKHELLYVIENQQLIGIFQPVLYQTNMGNLIIYQSLNFGTQKGDKVLLGNNTAPDGKYRLGFMKYLHVKDGKVAKY